MSINTKQIIEYIVDPVLEALGLKGRNLMLGTAAQESLMGTYIHQIGGPARGLWQPEDETHDWIWEYLLREDDPNNTREKRDKWAKWLANVDNYALITDTNRKAWIEAKHYQIFHDRLIYDLRYCCAIARLKYYTIPVPLPAEDDIKGMARYWKRYYNSSAGKGTEEQFIKNYNKYVKPYV